MYEVKLENLRVLAVRVGAVDEAAEVTRLWEEMRAALLRAPARVVATADFRTGALYRPEVFQALLEILKTDNPRVERSAHLVGASAIAGLQIERMVREAGNPSRRVFRVVEDALAFLEPALKPAELAWLRAWYASLHAA